MSAKKVIGDILKIAGISINGTKPWDIQIYNDQLYTRVLSGGSLALGESYMDGWWDASSLDSFFTKILEAELDKKAEIKKIFWNVLSAKIFNLQKEKRAYEVGEKHYDLGNELYQHMLDKRMVYSCGYWKNAKNLLQAQEAKLDLICKKLQLRPGMKILDIGCGWGSFAKFAAEKYKVNVVGITISKEQAKFAKEVCKNFPVEIRLADYRKLTGTYDRIVSIGMFEHVGYKNYRTYMSVAKRCLKEDGLFLLHTIGGNKSVHTTDPWIHKYIFPNSMLPSAKQITTAAEEFFVLEDWHNFGEDYDKTLLAWYENFERNYKYIKNAKYDERFYRMWRYYLLSCAGSFRARRNQVWQIIFSIKGIKGFQSIR